MSTSDRKIFIVIVHYGNNDVLRRCLLSLQSGKVVPHQIIVVDQNPEPSELDGEQAGVVRFTRPSTNDGYGAGLNFGIGVLFNERPASTDIVVGMNNDVVVYDDTIAQLQAWWADNPEPALVGVVANEGSRTVYGFGHINPWSGRANLGTKHSLLSRTFYLVPSTSYLTYVHGSFMSFPWEVFMKVRGVPEHYFLYWEDVAFSYRVRSAGFPLRLAAQVKIQHITPSPEEISDDKLYYLVRNGVVCLTSEGPTLWRTWWKIHTWLRTKYHQHWGKQPIVLQALIDAAAGVTGKRAELTTDSASRRMTTNPRTMTLLMTGNVPKANEVSEAKATNILRDGNHNTVSVSGQWSVVSSLPKVAAVVVTYNSDQTIERCIRSLKAADVLDIVVVDNASTDASALHAASLGVTVLTNAENVGFAAGCNQGAALLPYRTLLFLNPDAWLRSGSLDRALKQFSDTTVGIVGLQLVSPAGDLEIHSTESEVTLWNLFSRTVRRSQPPIGASLALQGGWSSKWVSGGAMLVRGDVWRAVQGFDPKFFLYWEDVDLCKRVRAAGWQVFLAVEAQVEHQRGASLGSKTAQTRHYDNSADRYFYKHYATPVWIVQLIARRLYRIVSPEVL